MNTLEHMKKDAMSKQIDTSKLDLPPEVESKGFWVM